MNDVDWNLVQSWIRAAPARVPGYRLDFCDGPFPDKLVADAVSFHHMAETAPQDDLEVADVVLGADDIVELDRALFEAGRQRWMIFVRDADGHCVGGTAVTFEPGDATLARQQDTAIDEAHRGLGLAKWAKAAMLDRIRRERPEVERVRTSNAYSNASMVAINSSLGFEVTETHTEWQARTADLRRALPA